MLRINLLIKGPDLDDQKINVSLLFYNARGFEYNVGLKAAHLAAILLMVFCYRSFARSLDIVKMSFACLQPSEDSHFRCRARLYNGGCAAEGSARLSLSALHGSARAQRCLKFCSTARPTPHAASSCPQ